MTPSNPPCDRLECRHVAVFRVRLRFPGSSRSEDLCFDCNERLLERPPAKASAIISTPLHTPALTAGHIYEQEATR